MTRWSQVQADTDIDVDIDNDLDKIGDAAWPQLISDCEQRSFRRWLHIIINSYSRKDSVKSG